MIKRKHLCVSCGKTFHDARSRDQHLCRAMFTKANLTNFGKAVDKAREMGHGVVWSNDSEEKVASGVVAALFHEVGIVDTDKNPPIVIGPPPNVYVYTKNDTRRKVEQREAKKKEKD